MEKEKIRFWDDPLTKLQYWLIKREQKWLREVIDKKYKGIIDKQVYWIVGTDDEKTGLSSDPVEQIVERLTLSQMGVFFAQRLWAKITWIITPCLFFLSLFLSYILFNVSNNSNNSFIAPLTVAIIAWVSFILCFASKFFAPVIAQFILPNTPIRKDEINNIHNIIKKCVVRDLPKDTPLDLQDRMRLLVVDSEGRSVAGQILSTDLEYSALRAEWLKTQSHLFWLGLAFFSPAVSLASGLIIALVYYAVLLETKISTALHNKQQSTISMFIWWLIIPIGYIAAVKGWDTPYLGGKIPLPVVILQWLFVGFCWFVALAKVFRIPSPLALRAMLLEQAVRETGTELLIDKVGQAHFVNLEKARETQLKNAIADQSAFIEIGKSTGLLAQRRDPLAPTEAGLPVGLTVNDLATHVGVLGASGTGKTFGVIRPITRAWLNGNMGGLLVLDGKGALPLELEGLDPDYVLISPNKGKFNPIKGMKPDAVADVLADVFSAEDSGKDKFWTDSARLMLRMAAILLHAHPTKEFNLFELQNVCVMSQEKRNQFLSELIDQVASNPLLSLAFTYWNSEFPSMPEQTRGSIANNVRTWLGNIVAHEILGNWVSSDNQAVQLEDCLHGAKIGLLLPESEYGSGGVAISALCMRRLYDAVKKRGDNWKNQDGQKPVLMAADEVQNLLTKSDLETVPVARSLGLYMMMATQNIDGLYKRLTKEGALQLLGNLASLIALPPRSEDSNKYVSERTGKIWKAATTSYHGLPDAQADIGIYQNSGVDASYREADLNRQSLLGAPRLSYSINLWHRSFQPKALGWLNDLVKPDETSLLNPKPMINFDLQSVIDAHELDTLLARPFSAVAILNRGKVQRRDVILLGGAA